MNVIVILSDEHSYSAMSNSGHPVIRTPNLDRIAARGTSFANAYTSSPICVPARGSLLTGQYAHQLGTWDNGTPYAGGCCDLFSHCAENGVDCTYIGRLDIHSDGVFPGLKGDYYAMRQHPDIGGLFRKSNIPRPNAIDRFDDGIYERTEPHPDTYYTESAIRYIHQAADAKQPFVMFLGYAQPHFPFGYQQKYWDYYDPLIPQAPDIALPPFPELNEPLKELRHHFAGEYPDAELIRRCHVGYAALVSEMDENVGQVLDAVEECGLLDNTLVIYTSDHGEQLGHHGLWWKCCMYEDSVHVPLLMYGAGVRAGCRTDKTASSVDLLATICEATGMPIPDTVQGESLLPAALTADNTQKRDFLFSEYHGHGMPVGSFMVKYRHYKYVYYAGTEEQLYDLKTDPDEMTDLLKKPLTPDVEQIRQECRRRLHSVCDPDAVSERALADQADFAAIAGVTEYTRSSCRVAATEIPAFVPRPMRQADE